MSLHLNLNMTAFLKFILLQMNMQKWFVSCVTSRWKYSNIYNWWSSHSYHVGRECLEAARLWFAGERQLQEPSFEHVKEQTGIHVAVLMAYQTWTTCGRVTQLLYPYGTSLALWCQWKERGRGNMHQLIQYMHVLYCQLMYWSCLITLICLA